MEQGLEIYKRPRLTRGQQELYSMLCEKVRLGEKVHFDEAKKIWLDSACQNLEGGVPYYYDNYKSYDEEKKQWVGGRSYLTDAMIANYAISWLLRNIGSLVIKGYLKVIPQLELEHYVKT